jgi:uncharacterized membrane protein YoaK (UPF0700 family)
VAPDSKPAVSGYALHSTMIRNMRGTALLALMIVAGIIDAVSILALGHGFAANMIGNLVFIGFAAAGEGRASGIS